MVCEYMHVALADASAMTETQLGALRAANPDMPASVRDEHLRWRVWMDSADATLGKLAMEGWRVSAVLPQPGAMILYVLERVRGVQPSTGLLAPLAKG